MKIWVGLPKISFSSILTSTTRCSLPSICRASATTIHHRLDRAAELREVLETSWAMLSCRSGGRPSGSLSSLHSASPININATEGPIELYLVLLQLPLRSNPPAVHVASGLLPKRRGGSKARASLSSTSSTRNLLTCRRRPRRRSGGKEGASYYSARSEPLETRAMPRGAGRMENEVGPEGVLADRRDRLQHGLSATAPRTWGACGSASRNQALIGSSLCWLCCRCYCVGSGCCVLWCLCLCMY
jgi:hypothetical protein